jgi:hypothetical protein
MSNAEAAKERAWSSLESSVKTAKRTLAIKKVDDYDTKPPAKKRSPKPPAKAPNYAIVKGVCSGCGEEGGHKDRPNSCPLHTTAGFNTDMTKAWQDTEFARGYMRQHGVIKLMSRDSLNLLKKLAAQGITHRASARSDQRQGGAGMLKFNPEGAIQQANQAAQEPVKLHEEEAEEEGSEEEEEEG